MALVISSPSSSAHSSSCIFSSRASILVILSSSWSTTALANSSSGNVHIRRISCSSALAASTMDRRLASSSCNASFLRILLDDLAARMRRRSTRASDRDCDNFSLDDLDSSAPACPSSSSLSPSASESSSSSYPLSSLALLPYGSSAGSSSPWPSW